jgi:hypothetical protein
MDFSTVDESSSQVEGNDFRPEPHSMVQGRVLHHDSDFLAYQCGYKYEEESLDKSIENLKLAIETARIMAGAETIVLHLTMGNKGGRYELARVKEYQAIRDTRPEGLSIRVGELRDFMANYNVPGVIPNVQLDQEADDSLTQAMYEGIESGKDYVMWSMDKDLTMAPGIHMNPKTYELEEYPLGYGECVLDRSGSSAKVVGKGKSFFWHQMLIGDGADNIPGLPSFSVEIASKRWPTKALLAAEARVRAAKTAKTKAAAKKTLQKQIDKIKPKKAGAVTSFDYLSKCHTNKTAFLAVNDAYIAHYGYGTFEYESWDGTVETMTAGDMLMEQAQLLWMRRYKDENVYEFFKEIMA